MEKEVYFKRQIALWGKENQNMLQNQNILIVGCGGLGCSLAMALGSSGLKRIDLIDFDTVAIHNIHRQIGFNLEDENKYKADVLKTMIESKSTFTEVTSYKINFEEFINNNNNKYDLILDATDNLPIRQKIDLFAKQNNTPWIYASVEEFHGQVCFFDKSTFADAIKVYDKKPGGIAAPIVMNIASIQANLAIRYLCGLEINKDTLYYCYFDKKGDYTVNKFSV